MDRQIIQDIVLLVLGLMFFSVSISTYLRFLKLIKKNKFRKWWIIQFLLICFFVIGYFAYLFILFNHERYQVHFFIGLSSLIFFFGAIFVLFTARIILAFFRQISEQNKSLIKSSRELEKAKAEVNKKVEEQTLEIKMKQKRLEEESAKVEQEKVKALAMLDSIGEGVIATDQNGRIMLINDASEHLLGIKFGDVYDRSITDALKIFDKKDAELPIDKHPVMMALSVAKKITVPAGETYYLKRKNGSKFPVAITVAPYFFHDDVVGSIMVFRDITIEKDLDKAKTEFVSIASHQLRTPLTAIRLYAEMMHRKSKAEMSSKTKEYLEAIEGSSSRMIRLVNDLLNVSRLETGRLKIDPKMTQIEDFIDTVISEINPIIKEKKCDVVYSKPEKILPKLPIDTDLLHQVVHNLLTNALRYSKENCKIEISVKKNKVDIDVTGTGKMDEVECVIISVSDHGIGIPDESRDNIFKKFFRAENAKQIETEGSGLGMYLTHKIMQESGGRVWFDSLVGKGTTFYIAIPMTGMIEREGEKGISM